MGTLLEHAQRHVASMVADLEGEQDFMPFMTIRDRDTGGVAYVGLMMPSGGDEKDGIADVMTALCAIHRTTEAVFVCTSWQVTCKNSGDPEAQKYAQSLPPSQHPDRVEVVFAHEATPDGDLYSSAQVIRQNNGVMIGEWSEGSRSQNVGGRFGDAIHMGIRLGADLPPEVSSWIDEQIAEGNQEELLFRFMRAVNTARAEMAQKTEAN